METPPKIKQKHYTMSENGKQERGENMLSPGEEYCLLFAPGWSKIYGN
jgi:hypothetical protein